VGLEGREEGGRGAIGATLMSDDDRVTRGGGSSSCRRGGDGVPESESGLAGRISARAGARYGGVGVVPADCGLVAADGCADADPRRSRPGERARISGDEGGAGDMTGAASEFLAGGGTGVKAADGAEGCIAASVDVLGLLDMEFGYVCTELKLSVSNSSISPRLFPGERAGPALDRRLAADCRFENNVFSRSNCSFSAANRARSRSSSSKRFSYSLFRRSSAS
jgi:hypothetical protein